LQFPLQRRAADLTAIGFQGEQLESMRAFQSGLRQQAFANRMAIGGQLGNLSLAPTQLGLGVASGIPVDVRGTLSSIAGAQGQTQTTSGIDTTALLGAGLQAGAMGLALASSREVKAPIAPLDGEALMARVKLLSTDRWRYKQSEDHTTHCGLYAEEMRELLGIGNGESITFQDAFDLIGVLFALVKELAKRSPATWTSPSPSGAGR
jgi:hypothetical protein